MLGVWEDVGLDTPLRGYSTSKRGRGDDPRSSLDTPLRGCSTSGGERHSLGGGLRERRALLLIE